MGTEDGTSNADDSSSECAEGVNCLKSNGLVGADGNCVAKEISILKSEAIANRVDIENGNDVAITNGVAVAVGSSVTEETRPLKSEAISNAAAVSDGLDSADGVSDGVECFQQTYKRRKHVNKSSSESKVQQDTRECMAATSHLADQVVKEPCDVALGNTSDGYPCGHSGNVVLQHLYQSLGDVDGGLEVCIREAVIRHPKISCATATTVVESSKIDKDGQHSLQFECLSQRTWSEENGYANIKHNGCSTEPHGHSVTEMCQRVLCNILTSEKFSSLYKTLLSNFPGLKAENLFDFSIINSRMKEHVYEQSPMLFLSDIQQVCRKLQDTGDEIVALAKILSNISRTSYSELFDNWEPDPHMKPEQTKKRATYEVCRCCGDMADGMNFLVCDSCEAMYHVSCIEPAIREMPYELWYCASCTASGSGSTLVNRVVCERLNNTKTLNNLVVDESLPTNKETLNELEENSNGTFEGIQISIGRKNSPNCKVCGISVDGDKIKVCGHPFCPNKNYHVRCLSRKQLMSYGRCWYCPSCLCRVCLADRDDDQIVLCDGCDHAYHTYCMKPPRPSIPRGKWFCKKCDAGIQAIRRAKSAYERQRRINADLEKKSNNKCLRELEKGRGMDMLLTAADSLKFEENTVGPG